MPVGKFSQTTKTVQQEEQHFIQGSNMGNFFDKFFGVFKVGKNRWKCCVIILVII